MLADLKKQVKLYKKLVGKCRHCGETDLDKLQFHHTNPKEKKYNISKIPSHIITWDEVFKEIKKCDLLCEACHTGLHSFLTIRQT